MHIQLAYYDSYTQVPVSIEGMGLKRQRETKERD